MMALSASGCRDNASIARLIAQPMAMAGVMTPKAIAATETGAIFIPAGTSLCRVRSLSAANNTMAMAQPAPDPNP